MSTRQDVMGRWSETVRGAMDAAMQAAGIKTVELEKDDREAIFLVNVIASLFIDGDGAGGDFRRQVLGRLSLRGRNRQDRIADAESLVKTFADRYQESLEQGHKDGAVHNYEASNIAAHLIGFLGMFVDERFAKLDLMQTKIVLGKYGQGRGQKLGAEGVLLELNRLAGGPLGTETTFSAQTIKSAKKADRAK